MGLLDVLNGMQNGPRGQSAPSNTKSSSGGMSPIATAVLGLLAHKAVKSSAAVSRALTRLAPFAPVSLRHCRVGLPIPARQGADPAVAGLAIC